MIYELFVVFDYAKTGNGDVLVVRPFSRLNYHGSSLWWENYSLNHHLSAIRLMVKYPH